MQWREINHAIGGSVMSDTIGTQQHGRTDMRPGAPNGQDIGWPCLNIKAVRKGLANWQTKRALDYIEQNLGSKVEIRQLANAVALSKSHFSRAFKRSLGFTPARYVVIRRVERAQQMMSSTAERLTDIAIACGFADQPHLNRYFRRLVGVSPGVWRRARGPVIGRYT
jgi:transcriptional regulator GlxA family with amidase domain